MDRKKLQSFGTFEGETREFTSALIYWLSEKMLNNFLPKTKLVRNIFATWKTTLRDRHWTDDQWTFTIVFLWSIFIVAHWFVSVLFLLKAKKPWTSEEYFFFVFRDLRNELFFGFDLRENFYFCCHNSFLVLLLLRRNVSLSEDKAKSSQIVEIVYQWRQQLTSRCKMQMN